ncbi:MAG: DNA polymerase III subunit gamma/tau [Bacteroidota bacterium]
MDNFIVSARKYRPATFDTVVGQNAITSTLKNAIKKQQLAQAFLFCGPRGIGKTTCARILAKTINCQHLTENFEPCNVCDSCLSFNNLTSFNIHELDAASNNSVDDIRALVDQVRIPPQAGKYKVYIIDEVHMLSASAFNAFLKTLEEPPPYAKFILATTEKHKILPTILSRCQIFDFRRITVDDIAHHLAFVAKSEGIEADADGLHLIAQKADGALRDALSIFDQIAISSNNHITFQTVIENLNILDYDYYFKMTEIILENRVFDALNLIEKVIENGFEGQIFLAGFASHLRNVLVSHDAATHKLMEASENIKNRYKQLASQCSDGFLIRNLDIANKFDFDYKNSNNKRLHLELAFIQMCNVSTAAAPTQQQPELKKKPEPLAPSVDNKTETLETPQKTVAVEPIQAVKVTSISFGDVISIKDKKPDETPVVNDVSAHYGRESFSLAALCEAWLLMTKTYEKQPSFYSALTKRNPEIVENQEISFTFDSRLSVNEFLSKKPAILHQLKSTLKNGDIGITELLSESEDSTIKPYSPADKFKKLVEKNPNLQEFKDQLDLEIEY